MKKPAGFSRRRACVYLFDLSGRLLQAMAVRRHGCPMMIVVAVMAEALHLFPSYRQAAALSNPIFGATFSPALFRRVAWRAQQFDYAIIQAIAKIEPARCGGDVAYLEIDSGARWP